MRPALLALLAACGPDAPDVSRYHEVGRVENSSISAARSLLVDGDVVYIGHRAGILAVNVANASVLGRNDFATTSGRSVERLFIHGDLLYAGYGDRLAVVDIASPATPAVVTTVSGNLQGTGDMARIGPTLVLGGTTGLRFLDVTDPRNPTDTAVYEQSQGSVLDFLVDGTIGYLRAAQKLVVMDLTDPLLGDRELLAEVPGVFGEITQVGDTVYSTNFSIVDVSNPSAPKKRNAIDQPEAVGTIAHLDDTILISSPRDDINGFMPAVHFYDSDFEDVGSVAVTLPNAANIVKLATSGDQILVLHETGLVVLGTD